MTIGNKNENDKEFAASAESKNADRNVDKQRSDERTHLRAAGFGYRTTLTSNVVAMWLASPIRLRLHWTGLTIVR
jgi:hypothetical protein